MNFYISQAISFCIIIPAVIGWVRFRKISPAFYPFLYLIWIGLANEIISLTLMLSGYYNIINFNAFLLVEAVFILWQFKRWQLFKRGSKSYPFLIVLFILVWILESMLFSKFYKGFNSYSRILYSFTLVFMSINMINQILMKERNNILKSSIFVICIGFVFMFTYALLVEIFYAYGLYMSDNFQTNLNHIFIVMNLISNIIYALAILWMPKRQIFSLQY